MMSWKGEKSRHSLAARGISTKKITEKYHKWSNNSTKIANDIVERANNIYNIDTRDGFDIIYGIIYNLELADNLLSIKTSNDADYHARIGNMLKELNYRTYYPIHESTLINFVDVITKKEAKQIYNLSSGFDDDLQLHQAKLIWGE